MNILCLLSFIASLANCLMAKIVMVPDGRIFEIPDPHMYPYILEEESPSSLMRLYVLSSLEPHATLLCPKGYSISEMKQELAINETLLHLIPRNILKEQIISLHNFGQNDDYKRALCPTAYHCLGYQACIFTYSADLCQREPIPLPQEYFVVSIGCYRDDLFDVPKKFRKNKDFVLHIKYSPDGEIPKIGFSFSNLTHVESLEDTIFNAQCPSLGVAKQEGYFGHCVGSPPPSHALSLALWPAMGTLQSERCRTKLIQTLCALHYSGQGLCIPPVYRNQNSKDNRLYSFQVLPQHEYSFSLENYRKFLSKKISDLIPARLAFVIMIKKNIKRAITTLHSVYRDHFLYVLHIDKEETKLREELESRVEKSFTSRHNIVLLPSENSFSTTFESYETVRAKMEGYENLLHLGIWDFVVTLEEDDVPLRNVEDLSIALAPHRGLSFLPDMQSIEKQTNMPVVSCGGLVHKFPSLSSTLRSKSNLPLFNSSDDGVLSREFVEYLVDESRHSKEVNDRQFFLQTLQFSHSSYIPTLLMNSPFKNKVHIAPMRAMKQKSEKYTENEPSHTGENSFPFKVDETMAKEYFLERDRTLLNKLSHRFFFGQKFSNNLKDDAQKIAIQLANGEYYQHLEEVLPMPVIRSLLEESIKNISSHLKIKPHDLPIESVLNIQIVPSLVPQQELCRSTLISAHPGIIVDYNYWIDVSTYLNDENQQKLRIMLQPSILHRTCYKTEHLRVISLSPLHGDEKKNSSASWSNTLENMPVPYFSSTIKGVAVNLLVADKVQSFIERGNIIRSKGKSGPIELKIYLQSPTKATRCTESTEIVLSDKSGAYSVKDETSNEDLFVKLHSLPLTCQNMETGLWTVRISQTYPRISKEYILQFHILDLSNQNNVDSLSDIVGSLWTVKHFAFVSENDSYDFYSDEIEQSTCAANQKESKKEANVTTKEFLHQAKTSEASDITSNQRSDKAYLFICGGGLVSSFALLLTVIVLFCGWKFRFHPKMVLCFLALLGLVTGFQIIVIISVCN